MNADGVPVWIRRGGSTPSIYRNSTAESDASIPNANCADGANTRRRVKELSKVR